MMTVPQQTVPGRCRRVGPGQRSSLTSRLGDRCGEATVRLKCRAGEKKRSHSAADPTLGALVDDVPIRSEMSPNVPVRSRRRSAGETNPTRGRAAGGQVTAGLAVVFAGAGRDNLR